MKWNGTGTWSGSSTMATRFAATNPTQRSSGQILAQSGRKAVPDVAHRLDQVAAQLGAEPGHVDLDDVAPRVVGVAPHLREQLLPRAHAVAGAQQVLEEQELAPRKGYDPALRLDRASLHIQPQAGPLRRLLGVGRRIGFSQVRPHPGDELGDGERL